MKNISHHFKNAILFVIISYRFMLKLLDVFHNGDHFSNYDWTTLVLFILLIFVYVNQGFFITKNSNTYTSLHLLYGSLLGEKIFLGLCFPKALILAEWIWLAVGIMGVLIHHMPEKKEEPIKLEGNLHRS